jgi:hypothetical protein
MAEIQIKKLSLLKSGMIGSERFSEKIEKE